MVRTRKPIFPSRIFTVPKSSGGDRLILDVSVLNKSIPCPPFKMTSHNLVRKIIPPGSWMASIDIRDAYLHIPIHPRFQKFLAFQHGSRCFKFRALPFGLNIAPKIFTAVMKLPLRLLREQGVRIVAYLDDLFLWAPSEAQCLTHVKLTCQTLQRMGFLINVEKSTLVPSQQITWVGVRWDMVQDCWSLTPEAISSTSSLARSLLEEKRASRLLMESMLGKAAWAGQILPEARLQSHYLASAIPLFPVEQRKKTVRLPEFLLPHLQWWALPSNLEVSAPLRRPPISASLWSDASDLGWGALSASGSFRQGLWSPEERSLHINLKETRAIRLALEQDLIPSHCHLQAFMDNKTAHFAISRRGSSRSPPLQQEVHDLFLCLAQRDMFITTHFLEGLCNVSADQLSRADPVPSEWELDPRDFQRIQSWRGPLKMDALASPLNTKLPNFISPFPHPLATATDFFSCPLESLDGIYLFPPLNLIPRLLQHLLPYQGSGVLVVPSSSLSSWDAEVRHRYPHSLQLRFPPFQQVQGVKHFPQCDWLRDLTARSLSPRS